MRHCPRPGDLDGPDVNIQPVSMRLLNLKGGDVTDKCFAAVEGAHVLSASCGREHTTRQSTQKEPQICQLPQISHHPRPNRKGPHARNFRSRRGIVAASRFDPSLQALQSPS